MTPAVVLLALALSPPGEYWLHRTAAAEAARAVLDFAGRRQLAVTVSADPATNVVRVSGEPAGCRLVRTLLADIDRPPPAATCQLLVVQTPAEYAGVLGLDTRQTAWTLTAREMRLLTAGVSQSLRAKTIDALSRPTLTVADGQTGLFEVTQAGGPALIARLTQRSGAAGKTLLRAETRLTTPVVGDGTSGQTTHECQVTAELENGGGLVMRGVARSANDGRENDLLWLATVWRADDGDR